MKLILSTESKKIYFHSFKGGNLILVQTFDGRELVYTYAEAVRLGIVQYDKEGHRIVLTHDGYEVVTKKF